MKLIATFITACLAVTLSTYGNTTSDYNDCSAELIVEKNRNSKSADEEGAQFVLVLTNTSYDTKAFNISVNNLAEPCNKNNSSYNRATNSQTIDLEATIQTNSLNSSRVKNSSETLITLNSGESYKFIVDVKVPDGTPFNIWSCLEVQVKSPDCKSVSETKTLSVFVVDPSEG